jgi:hypothetical protein
VDLFTEIVDEKLQHKNFKSVLAPFRKAERDLLESWAEGFVDRDGKLKKEFQTTFNSTFWEIYLFAAFKEYGFTIDWSHPTPDFSLSNGTSEIIVEAVTANAAQGKPNEWDKNFSKEELEKLHRFKELNIEAIIRLANAIFSKSRLHESNYKNLAHVKGKPFVLAVAPFEQPHFNHQYDRPIKALLYDYYVDEDAYLDNPEGYQNGPPGIKLGYVEKDNGAEIELGIFNNPSMQEISAVVFSCVATWGKLSAMSVNPNTNTVIRSTWATPPFGATEKRVFAREDHCENVRDGLQVFHNPFAKYPLPPNFFRSERVVQTYFDKSSEEWVHEGNLECLQYRMVEASPKEIAPSGEAS